MYGRKGWFNWCHCRYVYCRAKLKGHVYILGGDKWSYSYHLVLCNLFFLMLDSWSWSYVDGKYCKFFFFECDFCTWQGRIMAGSISTENKRPWYTVSHLWIMVKRPDNHLWVHFQVPNLYLKLRCWSQVWYNVYRTCVLQCWHTNINGLKCTHCICNIAIFNEKHIWKNTDSYW